MPLELRNGYTLSDDASVACRTRVLSENGAKWP